MTTTEKTCEQWIDTAMASRLEDIRVMLDPQYDDVQLIDDGTLDTVIQIGNYRWRYQADTVTAFRTDTGDIDLDDFLYHEFDTLRDELRERFNEYGLELAVEDENGPLHVRYLLSTGGPHEEIRLFINLAGEITGGEFVAEDWGDYARRPLPQWAVTMLAGEFGDYAPNMLRSKMEDVS